jgi:hypothetical protein
MFVDLSKHAVGLGGGRILSGSVSTSFTKAYWYYPVTATTANVVFSDLTGGNITSSFSAGVGISGTITSVTQSSGIAIVYDGIVESTFPFEVSGSGQASPDNPNAYTQLYSTASTDSSYGLQRDRTNGMGYVSLYAESISGSTSIIRPGQ